MRKIYSNKLFKKNFNANQFAKLQKFLSTQGLIIKKKSTFKFGFEKFKTIYLTVLSSFLIILTSFLIPIFSEKGPKIVQNSKINDSNKKFKKALQGEETTSK